jgi:hypothetical protein
MQFHVAIMQCSGEITDRGDRTTEQVRSVPELRQFVELFSQMLEEHLPHVLDGPVSVRLQILQGRGMLEWHQGEPCSAVADVEIGGQLTFSWLYLSGRWAEADALIAEAHGQRIRRLAAEFGVPNSSASLQTLPQRPLAVRVSWPPASGEEEPWRVDIYGVCLGVALFEKLEELLREGAERRAERQQRGRPRASRRPGK